MSHMTLKDLRVAQKADKSFVTAVDLEVEKTLRSAIVERFPEHGILGEEFSELNSDSDFQWIIDPIDGTLSLRNGIPLYGTIIALEYKGSPIVSVIDHAAIGHCYWAQKNGGLWLNGTRVNIVDFTDATDWSNEIVACGDRANFIRSNAEHLWHALQDEFPRVRTYSDCFGHTLAASGKIAAMVDFNICKWDIAATQLLVEEAGGKFELVEETKSPNDYTRYSVVLGAPKAVDRIVALFRKSSKK